MPYDTSLLDKAIAEKRARWERERRIVLARVLRWLDEHSADFDLREAYVFGSVAGAGRFDDRSDVDVAVEQISAEGFFDLMAALSSELDRDVDLVELTKCHFAHRIRQEGVRWTKKN
jgi:predicted nucleotidyltransferase